MTRTTLTLAAALALLSGGVTGARAQHTPQTTFEIGPVVGGAVALGDLPERFQLSRDGMEPLELVDAEFDDGASIGARAGIRLSEHLTAGASFQWLPSGWSTPDTDGDLDMFLYGADLTYGVDGPLHERLSPYAIVGVGGKTYDFDVADAETDLMWSVGGGVDVALGRQAALRFEARDHMSFFDPEIAGVDDELQHDLTLSVGLRMTPRGWSRDDATAR